MAVSTSDISSPWDRKSIPEKQKNKQVKLEIQPLVFTVLSLTGVWDYLKRINHVPNSESPVGFWQQEERDESCKLVIFLR